MSQSQNVFSVLDSDHDTFLQPFRAGFVPKSDCFSACELLAAKIRQLCDQYNSDKHKEAAAQTIIKFLRAVRDKKLFNDLKMALNNLKTSNPKAVLRLVNNTHSEIFDKSFWTVIFRLNGEQFPPKIVYKLRPLNESQNWGGAGALKPGRWHTYCVYRCFACKIPTTTTLRPPKRRVKAKRACHWINEVY